jgi:c-di-AMP phosphodiesterase-like protein
MENLLKGLLVVGGEIKVTSVKETASVELSGRFIIEKGNFKQEFSYWARTYEQFDNFAKIDDYEYETQSTMLGDLPIDNLNKLIQSLNDSGLSTLANSLGFSQEEIANAMRIHVQNHKTFKLVYGKKVELWDLLTQEERQAEILVHVINNYDTCGDWLKKQCGVIIRDEEGNVVANATPTKEQLQEKFLSLGTN